MPLSAAADALRACASGSIEPVILACSGGADSTFLAASWLQTSGLPPAIAVIVDHGHRAGSGADAEKARALLKSLGLRAEVVRADPPAPPGVNEESLRDVRYAALTVAAHRHGAVKILTAHTADDLAETVLLRIFRGTGLRGLAGIPARRDLAPGVELLRPLLALRRVALRTALAARGISWVEDPTNADPARSARARLRLHVLPALATIATGDPVQAVLRLATEARAWSESLDILLTNAPDWRALPPYLREQAVAAQLRALGETVSPTRLRDLAAALASRGRAGVGEGRVLCMSREGELSCRGVEHAEG